MPEHLRGLVAPPFTPMHDDGSVDLERIEAHAELLMANPVDGVFVCGSTGESMSLSVSERMEVLARWKHVVGGAVPLIAHVGHTCLGDARALAEHACRVGADRIAVMGPCFFKPARVEELVEFCARIADAAPDLPFYYYHIPVRTGVSADMVAFLQRGRERIPSLAGIKFSEPDLTTLSRCVALDGGRYNMLFGCENILLAGLAFGAHGSIGTLFNYAAPLFRKLIDAFEAGDMPEAQACQRQVTALMSVFGPGDHLGTHKAVMELVGVDCGPPRLPVRALSRQECDALRNRLEGVTFFDYCCRPA